VKLLLDTSVFLYLVHDRPIPSRVRAALEDPRNDIYLSLVTPWEMQIKVGTGGIKLNQSVRSIIDAQLAHGSYTLLPITLDHIEALSRLPDIHKDPFDRLLIAQAVHENLIIVTGDLTIIEYPVSVFWK